MAIDFSCSSCQKKYRVKDELAGKKADCSECGTRMRIPELVAAASESDLNLNSLIDDELPTDRSATLKPAVTTSCGQCGAPIALDAIVCVACGYDKRLGESHETESEAQIEAGEARTVADSLKRGGAFSFLGVMLGAAVWAAFAVFMEVGVTYGYPALAIGVLAGLGMARGFGKNPVPFTGMVASVMALAGIFAAKGLIFDQYRVKLATEGAEGKTIEEITGSVTGFSSMFDLFQWYDILFILVAMAFAYSLALGNKPDESAAA